MIATFTAALCACVLALPGSARPTDVIDRLMAVVSSQPILLSDVNAAMLFQLVPPPPAGQDPVAAALDSLIERLLMLSEVERYQPPEPAAQEIDKRVAEIEGRLGSPQALDAALAATGITRDRLRDYIRNDLRIATYLNQRFGGAAEPSNDEVLAYYRSHTSELAVNGVVSPYEAVAPIIRQRLEQTHRQTTVADWLASLRRRTDVTVLYLGK
jgi:hypothetical protein